MRVQAEARAQRGRTSLRGLLLQPPRPLRARPRRALPHLPAGHPARPGPAAPARPAERAGPGRGRGIRDRRLASARLHRFTSGHSGERGDERPPLTRETHRARQVALLAGRRRCLQRLPRSQDGVQRAARLRQRRLRQAAPADRLRRADAAIVSHMHADHWLDLVPYSYALTYAPKQQPVPVHTWPGTDTPARPRLIAPPGATEIFRRVVGAWGNDDLIENAFALEEYSRRRFGRGRPVHGDLPPGAALHRHLRDQRRRRGTAPSSPTGPTRAPATSWSRSRATPTCSWSRRPCRGPSARASAGT